MNRLIIPICLAATPVIADERHLWPGRGPGGGSWVEIHEPTEDHAVASVTFKNEEVHTEDERITLTYEGVEVVVVLDWQANDTEAERLTVLPPAGYIALPPEIVVPEGERKTVHIYTGVS